MNGIFSKQTALSLALAMVGLVGVYMPTFLLTSLLIKSGLLGRVTPDQLQITAAPLVMCISVAIAVGFMALLSRRQSGMLRSFGFLWPARRDLLLGLGFGLLGAGAWWVLSRMLPIQGGFSLGPILLWQRVLYFWIDAPAQEEIIFRGLLQGVVENRQPVVLKLGRFEIPLAALISALLFALVHLATARLGASLSQVLFIVCAAFTLGLLAGWLRWKSGSLVPGMLVHSLFNIILG